MFTVSMNFNNFLLSYRVFAKLPGAPTLNMSVCSRSYWNLEVLGFEERGKPECTEKNLS